MLHIIKQTFVEKRGNMATLKDVAKLANVDVSTVSRALNNTSYVHPETKKKIFDAVKELSYHPNILAKGLRQGKKHTIAIVVPRISYAVYADMIPAVTQQAEKENYQCIICITDDALEKEQEILSRLRSGLVDGIIITSCGGNNRMLRDISAEGISVLQAIRKQDENLSSIIPDYYSNAYEAVRFLYAKGCRNMGLIIGNLAIHPYLERYNGYMKAVRELDLEPMFVKEDGEPSSFEYGLVCTKKLFEQHSNIDAVLASLDIQGLGAQRQLKLMGKRVPQDVKLISLTGIQLGEYLETSMTSMEIPAREIGQEAVNLLIRDIEAKDSHKSVKKLIYQSTLVERETT